MTINSSKPLLSKKQLNKLTSFSSAVNEKSLSKICPTNLEEQKRLFLEYGTVPSFEFSVSEQQINKYLENNPADICFDYLDEARHILDKANKLYGNGDTYQKHNFGGAISVKKASRIIQQYLIDAGVQNKITVQWASNISCSAKVFWRGTTSRKHKQRANKRKFFLIIKCSSENPFLSQHGIQCLLDHEVSTHFLRFYNDGMQPWFSNRKRYDLSNPGASSMVEAEEGLANVHTIFGAKTNLLWGAAFLYYTACMSAIMSFSELFAHLGKYLSNREQRWKAVMRVKRVLKNPDDLGGYGKDQSYFAGSIAILRNIDSIDFSLMMSGRLTLSDLTKARHVVRQGIATMPSFMQNMEDYRRKLWKIAYANDLVVLSPSASPTTRRRLLRRSQQTQKTSNTKPPKLHRNKQQIYSYSVPRPPVAALPIPTSPFQDPDICYTDNQIYSSQIESNDPVIFDQIIPVHQLLQRRGRDFPNVLNLLGQQQQQKHEINLVGSSPIRMNSDISLSPGDQSNKPATLGQGAKLPRVLWGQQQDEEDWPTTGGGDGLAGAISFREQILSNFTT